MANATTTAILDTVRAKLPGVSAGQINLEMFSTVDELAREALRTTAPTDPTAEPDTWLSSTLWVPNYQVILEGTLYRLYAQVGKPWASNDLAAHHKDRYNVLLQLSRVEAASAPTSVYDRVVYNLRMRIPVARDAELKAAVFYATNKVRVEALSLAALSTVDATPSSWLPTTNWDGAYQSLLQGSLAQLYLQVDKAWSSPELGAASQAAFEQELALFRADNLSSPASLYQRLLGAIRVQAPTAREAVVKLALFATADKVRVDALRLSALTETNTDPALWVPSDRWTDCYLALLHGTLSRLQMQVGQPWSNAEAAGANQALFQEEFSLLRGDDAGSPTSIYTRIVSNIRVQIPQIRDNVLRLEIYNAADKIRVEALKIAPLTDSNTDPTTWIPSDKWSACYQALLNGALFRLFSQPAKPWTSIEIAAAKEAVFQEELRQLRGDELASPATVYQRIFDTIRVQLPSAREAVVKMALFSVANKIRVDALSIAPLTSSDTNPANWLPTSKWDASFNALFHGTLSRLQMQVGQVWSNEQAAAANDNIFVRELELLKTDEVASPATVYQRIVSAVRAQLPTAREAAVKLALFGIANKVRVDALRLTELTSGDIDPTAWIPTDKWDACYRALFYGTIASLQLQVGQPWSNAEAAAANQTQFIEEFALLRGDEASTPLTIYARLIDNLRVHIPQLRDGVLRLEVYNTADKIRREALWLTALTDSSTDPTTWLPSAKWASCYQALLHGTLFRLFSQSGKPWSNPELAKEQFSLYQVELDLVRGEQATKTPATNFSRLMDIIRVRLPGARDNVISIELYLLINEFLQETNVWVDEIEIPIVAGQRDYTVLSVNGVINRLMAFVDADDRPVPCTLNPPTLYNPDFSIRLGSTPSNATTYRAFVAIGLDPNAQPEEALPDWIITKYREGIEDGLLARLMMQVAKPYSNPKLAQYHGARYRRAIGLARNEALHAYKFRGQGWSYPRNFFGRRIARI